MRSWLKKEVYHIISEPGDLTRYDYIMTHDGPDEFIFAPMGNTFHYPQRLNYWDVKDVSSVEECIPIAEKEHCNPHTVLECIHAIKELKQ